MAYGIWTIRLCNSCAIEQESDGLAILPRSVAESIHQLFKLGRAFDLEENFIVIIRDLNVEMFDCRWSFWFSLIRRVAAMRRHFGL